MSIPGYPLVGEFVAFIKEREAIRERKESGKPRPWTKDEILDKYRFCNIHREDDAVTRWIETHWRTPHINDPNLWFAMLVARLFNNPETLKEIGYPVPFNMARMKARLTNRKRQGYTIFNAAYIVSTNGIATDKVDYVLSAVLKPAWERRKELQPIKLDTLAMFQERLISLNGIGGFIAAQIVADMKYAPPLNKATDWQSFAASGPGSRKGLNRVMGVDAMAGWRAGAWEEALEGLAKAVARPLAKSGIALHNQDLQNCLCEFDKYWRTKTKDGSPAKQIYKEKVQ